MIFCFVYVPYQNNLYVMVLLIFSKILTTVRPRDTPIQAALTMQIHHFEMVHNFQLHPFLTQAAPSLFQTLYWEASNGDKLDTCVYIFCNE